MEINSEIPFCDVLVITKDMCELINDESFEIVYRPVKLNDGNKIVDYTSIVATPSAKVEDLKSVIDNQNNIDKKDFQIPNEYCHITTYETEKKNNFISFDYSDNNLVKAHFTDKYKYIDNFFSSYINFRNHLISEKQRVKEDDIYQYFSSLVGFTEKERNITKTIIKMNRL